MMSDTKILDGIEALSLDMNNKSLKLGFSYEISELLLARIFSAIVDPSEILYNSALGKLRSLVNTKRERTLILYEMISRLVFMDVWHRLFDKEELPMVLKGAMNNRSSDDIKAFHREAIPWLNVLFGQNDEKDIFWSESLRKNIQKHYGYASISEEEVEDKHALQTCAFAVKESFLRNLLANLNIDLKVDCYMNIFSNKSYFSVEEPFHLDDISYSLLWDNDVDLGEARETSDIHIIKEDENQDGDHDFVVEGGIREQEDDIGMDEVEVLYNAEENGGEITKDKGEEARETLQETVYLDDSEWVVLHGKEYEEDVISTQKHDRKHCHVQ